MSSSHCSSANGVMSDDVIKIGIRSRKHADIVREMALVDRYVLVSEESSELSYVRFYVLNTPYFRQEIRASVEVKNGFGKELCATVIEDVATEAQIENDLTFLRYLYSEPLNCSISKWDYYNASIVKSLAMMKLLVQVEQSRGVPLSWDENVYDGGHISNDWYRFDELYEMFLWCKIKGCPSSLKIDKCFEDCEKVRGNYSDSP